MNTQSTTQKTEKLDTRKSVEPLVDVYENNDEILLVADLPGVRSDAVAIDFEKNKLTLSGKYDLEGEAFDYRRAFVVPNGIDAEKIQASMTNGVLRVSLPKSAALKPRSIEVKAG